MSFISRLLLVVFLGTLVLFYSCTPICDITQSNCNSKCVDLFTDRNNCGSCYNACDSDEVCLEGNCCKKNETLCGLRFRCIDLSKDDKNCGACGVGCHPDYEVCWRGKCIIPCSDATLFRCNYVCVSLQRDKKNCGKCGIQCKKDDICANGYCKGQGKISLHKQ